MGLYTTCFYFVIMLHASTLRFLTIAAALVLAVMSVLIGGMYWVVVVAINVILLTQPSRSKVGEEYSRYVVLLSLLAIVGEMLNILVGEYTHIYDGIVFLKVGLEAYISAFFMTLSSFMSGLMFISRMDMISGSIRLTKRWVVLFAMMFALGISVGSLFFEFVYLYSQGYYMFNLDSVYSDPADRISNNLMMAGPFVATFASAAFAIITTRLMRGHGKEILYEEGSR